MTIKQKIIFWIVSTAFLIMMAFIYEVVFNIGQDSEPVRTNTTPSAPAESSGPSPYTL